MKEHQGKMVEGRGAWAYPGAIPSRERAEQHLEPFAECNMNFIIVPATEGVVAHLLPVAHEMGLEFHVNFNMVDVPVAQGEFHPWRQVTCNGWPIGSGCPSNQAMREHNTGKMVAFLGENPGIDGVHLDGIWLDSDNYHGPTWLMYCYCDGCREGFKKEHGVDPLEIASDSEKDPALTEAWKRWRCELLNGYAREVREALKAVDPKLIYSGTAHMSRGAPSIFTEPYICSPNFQEWGRWLAEGIMEIFFPMPYTADNAGWREHLRYCRQAEEKTGGKGFTYPGVGVSYLTRGEQLVEQIELAREAGVGGVTLFPWNNTGQQGVVERNYISRLREIWDEPAVLPHRVK